MFKNKIEGKERMRIRWSQRQHYLPDRPKASVHDNVMRNMFLCNVFTKITKKLFVESSFPYDTSHFGNYKSPMAQTKGQQKKTRKNEDESLAQPHERLKPDLEL